MSEPPTAGHLLPIIRSLIRSGCRRHCSYLCRLVLALIYQRLSIICTPLFAQNNAKIKRNASVARCAPNPARLSSINLDLRSVTPAAVRLRLRPEQCCHLQLLHGPITAATIPSENTVFTTCVDPISPPVFKPVGVCRHHLPRRQLSKQAKMVEAPGTAPGSALLIPQHVYRHSWQASVCNIGAMTIL